MVFMRIKMEEALDNNMAPPVFLDSTHYNTLKVLSRSDLEKYAVN